MFGRRKESVTVPEVGGEAPAFALPSAQGGQLRSSTRTVTGPVAVVFYRPWSEEDIEFFKSLAANEDEVNMAGGSVVGIGVAEAGVAREFAGASGMKSMILYDYAKVTSREWGLLEKSKEHGDHSRPAVFVVDGDHQVTHAWVGERPSAGDVLAAVSGITGLPKPVEEDAEEKPKKKAAKPDEAEDEKPAESAGAEEKPKKLSAEEREKIKAERRAARESGKSVKTGEAVQKADTEKAGAPEGEKPKKMSAEERERIKAERRAARESGKSLKTPRQDLGDGAETTNEEPGSGEARAEVEAGASKDSGDQGKRDEKRAEEE